MRTIPNNPMHRLTVNKYCFLSMDSAEIAGVIGPKRLQQIFVIRVCSGSQTDVRERKLSISGTKHSTVQYQTHVTEEGAHSINIDASPVSILASLTIPMTFSTASQYFLSPVA